MIGHLRLAALLVPLVLAGRAQAQAFDCHAARSTAERMICADRKLGALDDHLDQAYRGALDVAAAPADLRTAQRAWLKQRDACRAAACLTPLYQARLTALAATPRAATIAYRSADLGVTFPILANRQIRPCADERQCLEIFGLRFGQRLMLLRLQAVAAPLETAARDEAGFEFKDGRWVTTYGRFEPQIVQRFGGRGWKGMKATITCGVSDRDTGFHAAGGECLWAVLSNGPRSILATTDGYGEPEAATRDMLASLTFDR